MLTTKGLSVLPAVTSVVGRRAAQTQTLYKAAEREVALDRKRALWVAGLGNAKASFRYHEGYSPAPVQRPDPALIVAGAAHVGGQDYADGVKGGLEQQPVTASVFAADGWLVGKAVTQLTRYVDALPKNP
jgi:hypothetical protein